MDRRILIAGLALALLLHACDRAPTVPDAIEAVSVTETPAQAPAPRSTAISASEGPPPGYTDGSGVNEGYPDLTPVPLAGDAEKGIEGARNFLLNFARAIELKEFDQAWSMLGDGDRQKWNRSAFTEMFADLGKISVAIPTGTIEGAAGSLYYTGPVTITAPDRDGRPVRIEGEAVLRRVNDIEGATAAQLRWHFDRLTLDWTH